jgi:ribosome-binding protein aMBF1 (putative translation factor)
MAMATPERQTLSRLDPARLVREARLAAGLSQAELAAAVGTKQSVVSRWERGLDEPRVSTLARILRACGLEADLTFRRRDGVDRSQIAEHLRMTPAQRSRYARSGAEAWARAQRARKVRIGA